MDNQRSAETERCLEKLPPELLEKIDALIEQLDLKNRETFVEAAVRRLIDHYMSITAK